MNRNSILTRQICKISGPSDQKLVIEKQGVPETILSDNGREFQNETTKNLYKEPNLEWKYSSPEHHETVGALKRVNQTLMNKIRKLSNLGHVNWASVFAKVIYAVNISFNRSIQMWPSFLQNKSFQNSLPNRNPIRSQSEFHLVIQTQKEMKILLIIKEKSIIKGEKKAKGDFMTGNLY